jgi:hypothetical protein
VRSLSWWHHVRFPSTHELHGILSDLICFLFNVLLLPLPVVPVSLHPFVCVRLRSFPFFSSSLKRDSLVYGINLGMDACQFGVLFIVCILF